MPNWLKKLYTRSSAIWKYFLLPVLITLDLACGPVDEEAEANKRFVEAVALLEAAEGESAAPAKLSLLEQAEATLQTIITRYPSTTLAVNLASGQQTGNVSLATVATSVEAARGPACQVAPTSACVIAQALALTQTLDGWQRSRGLDHITERLTNIALVQAQAGDRAKAQKTITQALTLAPTLTNKGRRPVVLADIAFAQAQAGDRAGSQATIAQALALARTLTDGEERGGALAFIALAQAQAGDRAEAQATIAQALALAQTLDEKGRVGLLAIVAPAQAQAGDRAKAQEAISRALAFVQTLDDEEQDRTLLVILWAHLKAGDTVQALALSQAFINKESQARLLPMIAQVQAQNGNRAGAQKTVSKALALARVRDEKDRDWDLARIAPALAQAGDHVEARATITQVLATQTFTGEGSRAVALARIAEALAYMGDGVQALALVQTITLKDVRRNALADIALALARVAASDAQETAFWNWVNSF